MPYQKKDIIYMNFQFADDPLNNRARPALVLANLNNYNYIVMQISKKRLRMPNRIIIEPQHCINTPGPPQPIRLRSGINCEMLTTVNGQFIIEKRGELPDPIYSQVINTLVNMIQ